MRYTFVTLLLGLTLLAGCTHTQPSKPIPAVIEYATPTMKAELQQAIVSLKGGIAPLLSDTAFINSSELLLEHGLSADHSSNTAFGTNSFSIQRFVLQLREVGCVLFYTETSQFIILNSVPCHPMVE